MPYPRKLLGQGEEVVLDFHPHWVYLARPVGWTALWLIVYGGLLYLLRHFAFGTKAIAFLAVLVAWVFTAGVGFLRWRTTEYVLTTDRLITREGIVAKNGREIPLERINDISFHQSVFERMVGSGDLVVESAGELGQEPFHNVPKPHLVQNEIYRQVEQNQARVMRGQAFGAPPPPPAAPAPIPPVAPAPAPAAAPVPDAAAPSAVRQIEELARLRDQGIISEADFQAKKDELLRRL
jgi:membrane protein YdbS with pleckstrin-like domain